MKTEFNIHPIQGEILRVLLFNPQARFSDLNTTKISSDHFSFHLKGLVDAGLLEKEGDLYHLTASGKEFANRLDVDQQKVALERQAKIGVLVIPVRETANGKEFLVQQRLKQPFYGFHGFVTGKIKWGETVSEAAARELEEETGLKGDIKLVGIKHKADYDPEGKLLEDKFFFACRASNCHGTLLEQFEGGKNTWHSVEDIAKLPDLFDGVQESINLVTTSHLQFLEDKYIIQKY